jgi:hypothetical protein
VLPNHGLGSAAADDPVCLLPSEAAVRWDISVPPSSQLLPSSRGSDSLRSWSDPEWSP